MTGARQKESVVTFKADTSLLDALRGVPNRSEFIRTAILAALNSFCPLCGGTGVLTPNQQRHWGDFAKQHPWHECEDCHEVHLVCACEHHSADETTEAAPQDATRRDTATDDDRHEDHGTAQE